MMANSNFQNIRVRAIKTVIPEKFIDIDDELPFFDNDLKKLARAKKMAGYGRRYILDEGSTVTDMCVAAAEKLFAEINFDRNELDLLLFVNQKPDYPEPCDACLAHGRLNLRQDCAAIPMNLGCSGYPHGLWLAHAMIQSGAARKCLLLAGDVPSLFGRYPENRKAAQIFGDAGSATLLENSDDDRRAYFLTGADGQKWDRIIIPFGGMRLPVKDDVINLAVKDSGGNLWTHDQGLIDGPEVFLFSTEIAPKNIREIMEFSGIGMGEIDFFAIHQANKQIVETIIAKAGIPAEKTTTETFTKYANNSTNSVVTVLGDQLYGRPVKWVVLCTFGIGLSWATCLLDLSGLHNGGISTYSPPPGRLSRPEQIAHWVDFFKGGSQ